MNSLSQYGDGTGQKSATVAGSSFVAGVTGNLSDGDVHTHLQAAINSGAIPAPPAQNTSEVVVIFLDESIAVRDPNVAVMCELSGDNAFGYHNYFKTANGNNCYYAVVPALDNNCIIESCPCQNQIGNNTTASTPFVTSDDFVFFQGTDNKLWKVKSDGSSQMQIGHNTTKSTPFVTGDGWVWFQGTDNKLWKVFNDGTQQSQPGNNTTSSSPFVSSDGWVYFQGTDHKLWRMRTDGSQQVNLNSNTTASTPTATPAAVFFRGTDNKLWVLELGRACNCSLNLSETQEQRRTQVASHELAEMLSDPEFPDGWFGNESDEIGDICNGKTATITVGRNTWNVQSIYSRAADAASNGATVCVSSAPSPLPGQYKIRMNTTSSTPFVTADGWVYFQGTDNRLWKVNLCGTSQMQIGHNTTKSTPFVTGDGWVWFQGTDNKLWNVYLDGTGQSQTGNNTTSSTPFVSGDGWVYFQGTDNKLWRLRTDGSGQVNLGGNTTASAPTAIGDSVYFRGTDNALWRFFLG